MLTPEQIQTIAYAVEQVAKSEDQRGFVVVQIVHGEPRYIFPAPGFCFPEQSRGVDKKFNAEFR